MKILYTLFFIITASSVTAQKSFKQNYPYIEVLGNGLILSANYEKQLSKKPGLGIHLGIGIGGKKPAIPIGLKYIFNAGGNKSFVETGFGITLLEREMWDEDLIPTAKNPYEPGFIPSIGYRHHTTSGFMFRINYTPVFNKYETLAAFGGITIGWQL